MRRTLEQIIWDQNTLHSYHKKLSDRNIIYGRAVDDPLEFTMTEIRTIGAKYIDLINTVMTMLSPVDTSPTEDYTVEVD